ncbi:RIP metalloprotease RseP [Coralloluteibacterium stylophorae]|uniref:Zinc metalloprotease n=1 Tax=Coralloluteibacterium stylophorae TaxID=1776034 RepID=A0AAP2FZ98_9GAMM|nr:RIP metalloprotease RseP [Coralloluteibacterium stylophorae]MBS7456346.1 RIP metalloprotease RseP [Coralloluteibacterium stylophorae]
MQTFFGSVWWLIVSLGLLVTFHEFGHFWVARRCGVRVLRFSVGFGRPLWKRVGRDGVEYVVAALPLGGYVRMLDEREGEVAPEERDFAFNRKPVWKRIAIVAAGPGANLVLCVALLWAMFAVGKPDYLPLVGRAEGIAAEAGFEPGDRILRIGQTPVPTWTDAGLALVTAAMDRRDVAVEVRAAAGGTAIRDLELSRIPEGVEERRLLSEIGLVRQQLLLPATPRAIRADSPAARAGIEAGDRLLRIGDRDVRSWDEIGAAVQAQAADGQALEVEVERGGERRRLWLTPEWYEDDAGGARWILGLDPPQGEAAYDTTLEHGVVDALPAAVAETWRLTRETFGMLARMVDGRASLKNISGPISIAQYANSSAQLGLAWFLNFLALLSLSLAVMNLLPIPVLDGGHLLYYLIELIKGSPLSERAVMAGQYVGLALLAGLMGLAFYNDILRLVVS